MFDYELMSEKQKRSIREREGLNESFDEKNLRKLVFENASKQDIAEITAGRVDLLQNNCDDITLKLGMDNIFIRGSCSCIKRREK